MPKWSSIIAGSVLLLIATPASAQDYLGSFLQSEQSSRVSELSQKDRNQRAKRAPTRIQRQTAWSRNKREYRRRLMRDGKQGADRWLDRQARTYR